ncbi:hypothetical protein PVK06_030443 [Gossypium arboreum]|uniref:Uncharacterized protein n=1 Tax=Gossypium arboreum TaxID=29729 RepID=A0ABR0NNV0_GOSAR|nr:hypothetical protein PVK06_030443 [Gossypium arboreum]
MSQNHENCEIEACRGNKRECTSISSSAPKYSSTEIQSQRGKVECEITPQMLKGKQGKESLPIESRQSNLNAVEKIAGDLVFERSPQFDLVNCYSMVSVDDFIPTSAMKNFSYDKFCDGDTLKWFPLKEGGHAINILSSRTISDSHIFGSDFVRFLNKRGRDLEWFFMSKWPDLRTNHFHEGGNDAIPAAS